jgi:uncharacterized membrane protein YdjX (TVP38/TMEM64 family)
VYARFDAKRPPIMTQANHDLATRRMGRTARPIRRFLPVIAIVLLSVIVYAMGWHRELSLETLMRHRALIDQFVADHRLAALAAFIGIYVAVVALSVPGAVLLTISSGFLFGGIVGALATIVGATIGAVCIFLIAKSAFGEFLVRRAGPLAAKLAAGFRADAFSYLLFLRLVPVFPFFVVNLVPALAGVRLRTFVAATALGILPATFAFAFFGAGLDSVIAAQESAYRACLAAARQDCRVDFELQRAITPELLVAFVALGIAALVPVVVKRWRGRAEAWRKN